MTWKMVSELLLNIEDEQMIIFHSRYINFLPFFVLEYYLSKSDNTIFDIIDKALKRYNRYRPSSRVMIDVYMGEGEKKIYFMDGGKKKFISRQAFEGYLKIFEIELKYILLDLYPFQNIYFYIGMLLNKLGYKNIANFFNKRGAIKIYKELNKLFDKKGESR